MYKDKAKQKEAVREAVRKHRQGITKGITQYHPILLALIDPVKRKKLEAITQSLKAHHVSELVSYGLRKPIPFDVVGELLEATR